MCDLDAKNLIFHPFNLAQTIALSVWDSEVTNYNIEIYTANTASNVMRSYNATDNEQEGKKCSSGHVLKMGRLMCPRSIMFLLRSAFVTSFGTGWEAIMQTVRTNYPTYYL